MLRNPALSFFVLPGLACASFGQSATAKPSSIFPVSALKAPFLMDCSVTWTDLRSDAERDQQAKERNDRVKQQQELEKRYFGTEEGAKSAEAQKSVVELPAPRKLSFHQMYSMNGNRLIIDQEPTGANPDAWAGRHAERVKLVYDGVNSLVISGDGNQFDLYRGLRCDRLWNVFLPGVGIGDIPLIQPLEQSPEYLQGLLPKGVERANVFFGSQYKELFPLAPATFSAKMIDNAPQISNIYSPKPEAPAFEWSFSNFQRVDDCWLAKEAKHVTFHVTKTGATKDKDFEADFKVNKFSKSSLPDSAFVISTYWHNGKWVAFHSQTGRTIDFYFDPAKSFGEQVDLAELRANVAVATR